MACGYYKPYAIALELRSYVKGYGLGRGRGSRIGGSGRLVSDSSSKSADPDSDSSLESYWSHFSYKPSKSQAEDASTDSGKLALFESKVPISTPEFENYRYGYIFKLSPQLVYKSCSGPEKRLLTRVTGDLANAFLNAVAKGDSGTNMAKSRSSSSDSSLPPEQLGRIRRMLLSKGAIARRRKRGKRRRDKMLGGNSHGGNAGNSNHNGGSPGGGGDAGGGV